MQREILPNASATLVRKAGLRVARDLKLSLRSSCSRYRAATLLVSVSVLIFWLAWNTHGNSGNNELLSLRAAARAPQHSSCLCENVDKWKRFKRLLTGADIVLRASVTPSRQRSFAELPPSYFSVLKSSWKQRYNQLDVLEVFKGSPLLVLSSVFLPADSLFTCTGFSDGTDTDDSQVALSEKQNVDLRGNSQVDESFLIVAGGVDLDLSRQRNKTILSPCSMCGALWAVPWNGIPEMIREMILRDYGESSDSWRAHGLENRSRQIWWHDNYAGTSCVSLIAACKDRTESLSRAFLSWNKVRGISEIVLVDWSSSASLTETLSIPALSRVRVTIGTVPYQSAWILSRAYNVALQLVTCSVVLKVDCDTILDEDFLECHALEPRQFYAGDWRVLEAPEQNDQAHVNGILLAYTSDLESVGGYDERITTYGWDDTDISMRLSQALQRRQLNYSKLFHLPHSDDLRTRHQSRSCVLPASNPLAPQVEIQRNRIISTRFGLPSWRADSMSIRWNARACSDHDHGRYAMIPVSQTSRQQCVMLTAANTLGDISDLVSEHDRIDAAKRAIRVVLLKRGISLLPKTLSLPFYRLLADQVGFPQRYVSVEVHLRGGCAARLLGFAAWHGATAPEQLLSTAMANEPMLGTGQTEASLMDPPSGFIGWRARYIWKHPDMTCTCRSNNVLDVPNALIVAEPSNVEAKNTTLNYSDAVGFLRAISNSSKLLANYKATNEVFVALSSCDRPPGDADDVYRDRLRASLRQILPTRTTGDAIQKSLLSSYPSLLDSPELSSHSLPYILTRGKADIIRENFQQHAVREMCRVWSAQPGQRSRQRFHIHRRAMALSAVMASSSLEQSNLDPSVSKMVRRIKSIFAGCPAGADEYLLSYPELAVILSGLFSAKVCMTGIL